MYSQVLLRNNVPHRPRATAEELRARREGFSAVALVEQPDHLPFRTASRWRQRALPDLVVQRAVVRERARGAGSVAGARIEPKVRVAHGEAVTVPARYIILLYYIIMKSSLCYYIMLHYYETIIVSSYYVVMKRTSLLEADPER